MCHPVKGIVLTRTCINIKMLLTATVVAILFVCDSTVAQNPYGLKRPSFCSTCFTNDKSENYHCCYYFFRCCAESRLGGNNRKVTTPSPEYPDLQTTHEQETTIATSDSDVICKKCIQRSGNADRSTNLDDVTTPSDGENTHSGGDGRHAFASVPKTDEVTVRDVDGSELSRGVSRKIPDLNYSPAFGGRRYPYNVPRVYPSQQPSRKTAWRDSQNSNPGRSNTRYGETFADSTRFRSRPSGRPSAPENSGDILWGRMEPVKDDFQWT